MGAAVIQNARRFRSSKTSNRGLQGARRALPECTSRCHRRDKDENKDIGTLQGTPESFRITGADTADRLDTARGSGRFWSCLDEDESNTIQGPSPAKFPL